MAVDHEQCLVQIAVAGRIDVDIVWIQYLNRGTVDQYLFLLYLLFADLDGDDWLTRFKEVGHSLLHGRLGIFLERPGIGLGLFDHLLEELQFLLILQRIHFPNRDKNLHHLGDSFPAGLQDQGAFVHQCLDHLINQTNSVHLIAELVIEHQSCLPGLRPIFKGGRQNLEHLRVVEQRFGQCRVAPLCLLTNQLGLDI